MNIISEKLDQHFIEKSLIKKVLRPYRDHSCYLKNATLFYKEDNSLPAIKGSFEIEESCYIDDTGHFNAVEFNICFNQLGYTYLAHCCVQHILPELEPFSDNDGKLFFEKQLSNILIVKISATYKKPINAKKFFGEIEVKSLVKRKSLTYWNFYCHFFDKTNGKSSGEITVVVLNP